jgi:glycine cleavage system H protein
MTQDRKELFKVLSKQELHLLPAVGVLRIPQGLFYSRNHTWTHLEKSGLAEVGIDDFLMHITGEVEFRILKKPGNFINKGDLLAEIDQNGKQLQIYSPISGRIIETNSILYETPGIINEDPYEKGWIYKIQPSDWVAETESCYLANEAITWSKKELERFKDFMAVSVRKYSPETAMIILQDGGELKDRSLSVLPGEVWQDFQESFLD